MTFKQDGRITKSHYFSSTTHMMGCIKREAFWLIQKLNLSLIWFVRTYYLSSSLPGVSLTRHPFFFSFYTFLNCLIT